MQPPESATEERRKDASAAMLELIAQVQRSVDALDKKLDQHAETHKAGLKAVMDDAFPEGDADGHRRHHEAVIKAAEDRAKFWSTMRIELAKWGLIGFAGWVAVALWQHLLQGPKP